MTGIINLENKFDKKVTVQEIADTAGVSKKTIYNHFNGKEDLFYRTFEWQTNNLVSYYNSLIFNTEYSHIEKLSMAINHAAWEIGHKHNGPIHKDLQGYNPYLKNSPLRYLHRNIQNAISELIDQSQKEGLCRKDISKEKISYTILSIILGLFIWEDTTESSIPITDLSNTTLTLIMDGLLTEKGHLLLSMEKIIL